MQQRNLTTGSIWQTIVSYAIPYLISCFLQIFYGLADLFFIGQYCNVPAVTAVSIGSQVMHMVIVMICSLAMGTTVSIAVSVGANDSQKTSRVIGNSITLFGIISLISSLYLIFKVSDIVSLLSTPTEAVEDTVRYLTICFSAIPVIVAYNIVAAIYRGLGDSRSPMYFIFIACVINVILDYIFIGIYNMGTSGAAMATIIAQLVSVIVALIAIKIRKGNISFTINDFKLYKNTFLQITKVGLPICFQDGVIQVGFLVITYIANSRGLNDAAAVGIVEKVISIFFLIPSAMLSTVSALSAQNFGAKKYERARKVMWDAIIICVVVGTVASIITQFYAENIVMLFKNNKIVVDLGADYLRIYVWDCIIAGMHFCFSGLFCACGKSILSFLHNVISMSCFRVPLSFLASYMYPTTLVPMGMATVFGSFMSLLMCIGFYIWLRKIQKI